MITEHERSTGVRYTHVVRTRPDLQWFLPARPPCAWPDGGARLRDWVFFMPRRVADVMMQIPYQLYLRCDRPFPNYGAETSRYILYKGCFSSLGLIEHDIETVKTEMSKDLFPVMRIQLGFTPVMDYPGVCIKRWGKNLCEQVGVGHPLNKLFSVKRLKASRVAAALLSPSSDLALASAS